MTGLFGGNSVVPTEMWGCWSFFHSQRGTSNCRSWRFSNALFQKLILPSNRIWLPLQYERWRPTRFETARDLREVWHFSARILVKISRVYISFPLGMRTLHHSCGVLMRACSQYFKSFHNRPAISFREVSQCPLCSIVVHSKGSLSHLQQLHTGRVLFSNENNSQIYEHAWKSREMIHWKSPFKRC